MKDGVLTMSKSITVSIKLLIKYRSNFKTTDVEFKIKNLSTMSEAYVCVCRCLDYFKECGTSVDECSILDAALRDVRTEYGKKRLVYTLDDYLQSRCMLSLKSISEFRFSATVREFN